MSWLLAFCGFAVLIILHEFGHFAVAKAVGMRVERFMLFFPPKMVSRQKGETEYGIGLIPLGGYVKITGMNPNEEMPPEIAHRAYYRQAVWKRIAVISAGPAVNIILAFIIFWFYFVMIGPLVSTTKVDAVQKSTPAASLLSPNDKLVAVDGVRGGPQQLTDQIQKHKCAGTPKANCSAQKPVQLTIKRDGHDRTVSAFPFYDAKEERMRLGFNFHTESQPVTPIRAADLSVSQMWAFTAGTMERIAMIFDAEKRKDLSGVVGSYEVTRQQFSIDFASAIFLLGIISLSLGVINLLPFLPLDGGHIFWAIMEKIRGKAIPFAVLERASFVGFALVLALFAIGLSNDIGRLTGPGFGVR